jgi:hypothetical protein
MIDPRWMRAPGRHRVSRAFLASLGAVVRRVAQP